MSIKRRIVLFLFPFFRLVQKKKPVVLSISETMNVLEQGKSLARFGDGELQAITGNIIDSFQENDAALAKEMKYAIQTQNSNLMIAIPTPFSLDFSQLNQASKEYWEPILVKNWLKWRPILLSRSFYYNAFITRPYFDFYENTEYSTISSVFQRFKELWKNKVVLIVEGEYSRFGVNDDLLESCDSVFRIIGPSSNAFRRRKEIEQSIRKFIVKKKIDIVLLSLGQTASLLACHLVDVPIQVIDIGHLDIEYNWFLNHAKTKVAVPGKWVNESKEKFVEFQDISIFKKYRKQIIAEIK